MRELGAARDHRVDRAARLRRLLRGARRRCRPRSPLPCPSRRATTTWGTPSLDLGAGVRAQLERRGCHRGRRVPLHPRVADLYSYRRDGAAAGRQAGLIRLRGRPSEPPATRSRAGLARVRERIDAACADAGRDPDDVRLVVVTKTFPASDVRLLAELGVTDVGENRHQEAEPKAAECADLDLRWHFVGQPAEQQGGRGRDGRGRRAVGRPAQAGAAAGPARTASTRRRAAPGQPRPAGQPAPLGRGRPTTSAALADAVAAAGAPHAARADGRRPARRGPGRAFGRLAEIRAGFLAAYPSATWLSAGMSGDLEHGDQSAARHTCVSAPRSSDRGLRSSSVRSESRQPAATDSSRPEGRQS